MLYTALILGLLGSFHCIGMCGPIAFMLPVDRTNSYKKIAQISAYHLGRLIAYSLMGLFFGLLGKGLYLFGFQQKLSIILGILMIVVVLIPQPIFNRFNFSKPLFGIILKIKSGLGTALKRKSADALLTIGFLNGFLPCGLVYMAIFAAIAMGNVLQGSLYMFVFGIGTIPLMTTVIYFGKFLNTKIKTRIRKAIPVFVVIVGLLFILRGLGLGIPFISPEPVVEMAANQIECH
ncbi:MAG: sulfite exporter TauE/SafE family protein [Bacteroidia bacterium]|nr:sulfite exporter TauE/SafE family protein [Bacteroidia bacterium]